MACQIGEIEGLDEWIQRTAKAIAGGGSTVKSADQRRRAENTLRIADCALMQLTLDDTFEPGSR